MKNLFYSLILLIILFSNFSCFEGNTVNAQSQTLTVEKLYLSEWEPMKLPNSGLKMKIPFELNDKHLQVPEQAKTVIKSLKTQEYKLRSEFYILCAFTEYTSDNISLTNAAREAMANLKRQSNISNVNFKEKDEKLAGISAKIQSGTYYEGNRYVEFSNVLFVKGPFMNSIVITNNAASEYGKKIREKIVESIIAN